MGLVLLDTSALIATLNTADRFHAKTVFLLKQNTQNVYIISSATLSESLVSGYRGGSVDGLKLEMQIRLGVKSIVPVTIIVARAAAMIRATQRMKLADALICGTAITQDAELWTCDLAQASRHPGRVRLIEN